MSISLNVVNIAHVFWASLRRAAIFKRIRDIFTLVSDRVPLILFGSIPVGAGAGCCLAGVTEIWEVGVSRCGPLGTAGIDGVVCGAAPLVSTDGFDGSALGFGVSAFASLGGSN